MSQNAKAPDEDGAVPLKDAIGGRELDGPTGDLARPETAVPEDGHLLREVFDSFRDGLSLVDRELSIVRVNRWISDMYASEAPVVGRKCYEVYQRRETACPWCPVLRSLKTGERETAVVPYPSADRPTHWFELDSHPVRDDRGSVVGVVEHLRDMTVTRQAEAALRESEERFRAVFEGCLDAIFLSAPESGRIIDANPAASELLLRPREEIVGLHQWEIHPPGLRAEARAAFVEQTEDRRQADPMESRVLAADGRETPVEVLGQTIQVDGVPVVYCIYRDISGRKRAEAALRESERRYRLLAENVRDVIWIADLDLKMIYVSPSVLDFVGFTPEEAVRRDVREILTPESAERSIRAFYDEVASMEWEGDVYRSLTLELEHVRKDGSTVMAEVKMSILQDEDERPVGIVGVSRDITERLEAEAALRASEALFRSLVKTSPDAIAATDLGGKIIEVSYHALRELGYDDASAFAGRSGLDFIHPDDRERAARDMLGIVEVGTLRNVEYRLLRRDGSYFDAEVNASLIRDDGGEPRSVISISRDVTRRKQLEAELARNQRLESVGNLAAGIAHDFNNFLTGILTNLSLARKYGKMEPDIERILSDAERACGHARGLTDQLLTFADGGAPVKEALPVWPLLKDAVDLALSGSNVRCSFSVPDDLWGVDADPSQLRQLLHNLVTNADQSMPDGGIVRVRAENAEIGKDDPLPLRPGRYVKISVEDEGIGIPRKLMDKIFDPFFTTKGKVRGLGLTSCHSIVQGHGGHIHVESRVEEGSTFRVYLPASDEQPRPEQTVEEGLVTGQGRILVVDDEEIVLRAIRTALTRLGYRVEVAEDGREGIRRFEEAVAAGTPFDLVIMDLTIPGGMGGKEAVRELRRKHPDARVVASSGYSHDRVMSDFRSLGFCGAIRKPFQLGELALAVQQVIEGIDPA